ncbi:hypothetical protein GGQ74_001131 [Desulfobaculum xiamenense]|uniref:Tip attachment protein J domain-containing protein n=1 Tax=Desulfobaculum xiamenense TaxID=995050 RepID=A0A846QGY8_9BACT|nr:hypothetical protein [Desulfobaculum xiamenense]NJB67491.1 hypothetical protein [Desulfobaculum xiamenense]
MIPFSALQSAILAADTLRVWWLFDVRTSTGRRFRWSTQHIAAVSTDPAPVWESGADWEAGRHWGGSIGADYDFRITDFQGVTLRRARAESGLAAPSETSFTIVNGDSIQWESGVSWEAGAYWAGSRALVGLADMMGAAVLISLYIGDRGHDPACFRRWRFRVRRAEPGYKTIRCVCEDYYAQYLRGTWPTTPNPRDLWPSDADADPGDDYCVPVVFGTAYVPLRSVFIGSRREYVLGAAGEDFAVDRVRSPREWGAKTEWAAGPYSLEQYTRADAEGRAWRTLRPIVADSDGDSMADAMGLWRNGTAFLDMPARFSASDTALMTNPADIIKHILRSFGLEGADIDDGAFAAAAQTMDAWGLRWNGGCWRRMDRQKLLSRLLAACHCTLVLEEQVQLRVLRKASVRAVGRGHILGGGSRGGSFSWDSSSEEQADSVYVGWQTASEAQNWLIHTLVPAKVSKASPSSEVLDLSWVQDSRAVQRLGSLYAQRALMKEADVRFQALPRLLDLQPADVVTLIGEDYGGTNDVIVDEMAVGRDLALRFSCSRLSVVLDDWENLAPASIAVTPDMTASSEYWTPSITGPGVA